MAIMRADEKVVGISDDKTYSFTASTFIKREIPLNKRNISWLTGKPVVNPWLEERFRNEAAALELIRNNTNIPVPRLISSGKDENGLLFLETELVLGSVRADMVGDECRMPQLHKIEGECNLCKELARKNSDRFVKEIVLPELSRLKASETGLNGFVIPPPYVLNFDERTSWKPKMSPFTEYSMTHGDLTHYNIMLNLKTLEVVSIIDWEHSGYFPSEFQQWHDSREGHISMCKNRELIRRLIAMIEL